MYLYKRDETPRLNMGDEVRSIFSSAPTKIKHTCSDLLRLVLRAGGRGRLRAPGPLRPERELRGAVQPVRGAVTAAANEPKEHICMQFQYGSF